MSVVNAAIQNVDEDAGVIGTLHWWSIHETLTSKDVAREKWLECGMPEKLFRFKSTAEINLRRAMRRVKMSSDFSIDTIRNDKELVLGLSVREIDRENDRVQWPHAGNIILNKSSEVLSTSTGHPLLEKIVKAYPDAENWLDENDMRHLAKSAINWANGILVRETGGIYFIPSANSSECDAISRFIDSVPTITFYVLPVVGTIKARKDLGQKFESDIEKKLELLRNEISSSTEGLTPRIASNRVSMLNDLKKKVDLYVGFIDIKKSKLVQQLAEHEEIIKNSLISDDQSGAI